MAGDDSPVHKVEGYEVLKVVGWWFFYQPRAVLSVVLECLELGPNYVYVYTCTIHAICLDRSTKVPSSSLLPFSLPMPMQ